MTNTLEKIIADKKNNIENVKKNIAIKKKSANNIITKRKRK